MFEKQNDGIVCTFGPVQATLRKWGLLSISLGRIMSSGTSPITLPRLTVWVQRCRIKESWLYVLGRLYVGYVGLHLVTPHVAGGMMVYNLEPAPVEVAA